MAQYFEALNNSFLAQYKEVYEPDPEAPVRKRGMLGHNLDGHWPEDVFGGFDKVCRQNGHSVWLYLQDNNKKIKLANARAEKSRMEGS